MRKSISSTTVKQPKYRRHSQRDFAFVEWNGQRHRLPGAYSSDESKAAYEAFVQDVVAAGNSVDLILHASPQPGDDLTIADLVLAYLTFAESYYPPSPRSEFDNLRHAFAPLLKSHAATLVNDFGPRRLKELQRSEAAGKRSRGGINAMTGRIKRMFRWAAGEELAEAATAQAVCMVPGLRRGRSQAPESTPRQPVAWERVAAVLDELPSATRAAVLVMWHTGARTGSVRLATAGQFNTDVNPWEWRPKHKNEFRGRELVIYIGPKCQDVLRPFLESARVSENGVLFSPRSSRKNPIYRPRYGVTAIALAVRRAIDRVNENRPEVEKVPHWSPHQLRHSRGQSARELYGVEGAQAVLGHDSLDATQIYAGRRVELARRIAMEDG